MITAEKKYQLDRMNSSAIKNGLGSELNKTKNVAKGIYDFSTQGGVFTTAYNLLDDDGVAVTIPSGAIVKAVYIHTVVAVTSLGSATISLQMNAANDLLNAEAKATFALNALVAGIPVDTMATAVRATADRIVKLVPNTATLTAGKLNVFIEYVLSV